MLKGNFADFSLEEIFWLLSRCSKTGRLTVAVARQHDRAIELTDEELERAVALDIAKRERAR